MCGVWVALLDGNDDDDDNDDRSADKDGRSTMKHLPIPPADDNRKKGGSMRSHAKGTKLGMGSRKGRGEEGCYCYFSADPPSGVVRELGGEAGFHHWSLVSYWRGYHFCAWSRAHTRSA